MTTMERPRGSCRDRRDLVDILQASTAAAIRQFADSTAAFLIDFDDGHRNRCVRPLKGDLTIRR